MPEVHGDSARRLSPRFPTVPDAKERRLKRIEDILGQTFLGCAVLLGCDALIVGSWTPAIGAALCGVCFISICFIAGSRQFYRAMGKDK